MKVCWSFAQPFPKVRHSQSSFQQRPPFKRISFSGGMEVYYQYLQRATYDTGFVNVSPRIHDFVGLEEDECQMFGWCAMFCDCSEEHTDVTHVVLEPPT